MTLSKPRNADVLISEADFARDDRLPYWADLWPSALALAEFVEGREAADTAKTAPRDAATRAIRPRAIELGCGLGLVTIAALRAGYDVTATDYYEDALRFTTRNARRTTGREPAVRMVDWRALPDDLGRFDLVLAADVLYELPHGPLVAGVIDAALAPGGRALIADQERIAMASFIEACAHRGLAATEIHRERRHGVDSTSAPTIRTLTIHEVCRT